MQSGGSSWPYFPKKKRKKGDRERRETERGAHLNGALFFEGRWKQTREDSIIKQPREERSG